MSDSELSTSQGIKQAVESVADSGKQLMVNQFALIGAEAREGLDHAVNRLIEAFTAILLGFCGFIVLTIAGVRLLEAPLGQPVACGIVGGSYMLIAFFLARMSAGKHPVTGGDNS